MSFLPSRMSRVLVGGHQRHMASVIEALHKEGVVHLEDFHDDAGLTKIGTPLEAGAVASENLTATRGLQKALGTEDAPAPTHDSSPERTLADARASLEAPIARVAQARSDVSTLAGEAAVLLPLSGLDVDLGLLNSLRSVKVLVGTCRTDPRPALQRTGASMESQVTDNLAVAVVVPVAQAALVEKALSENGFTAASLPAGKSGTPAKRLAALATEEAGANARLAEAEKELARLRELWGMRLASAEKAFLAAVEKTQAPLQFGVTNETFHVEGWVPAKRVADLEKSLKARFGDSLYVHSLGDAPAHAAHGHAAGHEHSHDGHGHAAHAGHDHAAHAGHDAHDEEHHDDPESEPPIHLENGKPARGYQWILSLLGMPRYSELNPSRLLWFFFPVFFALMVGDVVTGILITLFGHWLKTNKLVGIGGPAVGKALMAGGILTIIVGAFVFGEALGIHFVIDQHAADEGEMSWENILGLHLSTDPHDFLHKTGGAHVVEGAAGTVLEGTPATGDPAALATHASTTSEATGFAAMVAPHSDTHLSLGGYVNLGYYSKLHDVQPLMVWALVIAVIHITLGFILGYRNVKAAHGPTLALQEKGAWLTLMAGIAIALLSTGILMWIGWGVAVASIALLWMGAAKVYGAGYIAILELPGLVGNIVSYTRLAAIGAAEAGLALAVNTIAFDTIGGGAVGWVLYVTVFAALTLLSILSGSLQSLRLQFVEFFGKFFVGGGRPYVPFGRRAN